MLSHARMLEILVSLRSDQIIVSTMGSVDLLPRFSDTKADFAYLPSSMGQGIPLALGLALACPNQRVLCLCGDGSLLMNPGCLATVAEQGAALTIIVVDNGIYEVTGGQKLVHHRQIQYSLLARAFGIPHVYSFHTEEEWLQQGAGALNHHEPTLIVSQVQAEFGRKTPLSPRPMHEQIARLREALGVKIE